MGNTFVGFGFGAIQSGLFLYEAARSGRFDRLVVAEVMPEVVAAVRAHGTYHVNIATASGVNQETVEGVEIYNPAVPDDQAALVAAIAEASAMATALPSVDFYAKGNPGVVDLIAQGIAARSGTTDPLSSVIYAGENNNSAAELLAAAVQERLADPAASAPLALCHFANTVIGKMSQVIVDAAKIDTLGLARIAPGIERAFLVEAFNRIMVTQSTLDPAPVGIDAFIEQPDLLPFEEAKLYGHNAVHALVGYLGHQKGYDTMSAALDDPDLRAVAREAFLHESGNALVARHAGVDPLFTDDGIADYANDLIERMANPYLEDRIERIIRDPLRKLGWDDRLVGAMRMALDAGITPRRFAQAAQAALQLQDPSVTVETAADKLREVWGNAGGEAPQADNVIDCIIEAWPRDEQSGAGVSEVAEIQHS